MVENRRENTKNKNQSRWCLHHLERLFHTFSWLCWHRLSCAIVSPYSRDTGICGLSSRVPRKFCSGSLACELPHLCSFRWLVLSPSLLKSAEGSHHTSRRSNIVLGLSADLLIAKKSKQWTEKEPQATYCHVCTLAARQGDDGLENKRWAAAYFQPGTGPPPSQMAEQWYQFLPEPLSELSQAAETKLDTTASHESSAKGNIACFPHPIPPPLLSFLITLPLTSGGKKKEKNGFQLAGQSFFSLLARQAPPFTNLLGPWTLYSPNSPQIHLLFLSNTFPNMPLHSAVRKSEWLKLQAQYEWNMRWHKSEMGKALRCQNYDLQLGEVGWGWEQTGY